MHRIHPAVVLAILLVFPAVAVPAGEGAGSAALEAVIGDRRADALPRPAQATAGSNWWLYDVQLKETGGDVGVTVESWRKCYGIGQMGRCDPWRGNISELFGTDRIPAGGSISLIVPAWVWAEKTGRTYTISATYRGRDDNGRAVEAGYEFSIKSE